MLTTLTLNTDETKVAIGAHIANKYGKNFSVSSIEQSGDGNLSVQVEVSPVVKPTRAPRAPKAVAEQAASAE